MKQYLIKRGQHKSSRRLKLLINKCRLAASVMFPYSCRYDLGTIDQPNINTLFGIGYFPRKKKNSVSFGWRYMDKSDLIEILACWEVNGEKKWEHMCLCNLNITYTFIIRAENDKFTLSVHDNSFRPGYSVITDVKKKMFGYFISPAFNKNRSAPHHVTISIEML